MGNGVEGGTEIPTGEGSNILLHNGVYTFCDGSYDSGTLYDVLTTYSGRGCDVLLGILTDVCSYGDYLYNVKTLICQYEKFETHTLSGCNVAVLHACNGK